MDTLGHFEQLVLLAMMRVGDDAYGVPIHREILKCARHEVTLGTVYKTLDRLEQKGLIDSYIGEPTAERGGRRRKHYRLRVPGREALRHSVDTLRRMLGGLEADLKQP